MKTEEFDDKIRQKIESIETSYTNAEVEAAIRYSTGKTSAGWSFKYAGHAAVAALAASITALIVWNVALQKQTQLQDQTIVQLTKSLHNIETRLLTMQHDTVFVIANNAAIASEKLSSNNNFANPSITNAATNSTYKQRSVGDRQQNTLNLNAVPDNSKRAVAATQNAVVTKPRNTKNWSNSEQVDKSAATSQASKSTNIAGNNNILTNNKSNKTDDSNDKNLLATNKSRKETALNQTTKEAGASNASDSTNQMHQENVNTLSTNESNNDSTAVADSIPQQEIAKVEPPKQKQREPIDWSKVFGHFDVRYGLALEGAPHQFGVAAIGELRFNTRLGLLTGVKLKGIQTGNYNDRDEFWRRRGYDFANNYSLPTSSTDQTNINTRTGILQVPIYLNYYHALRNNYSLMLSAGVDLDLAAWQSIEYDQQSNTMHKRHNYQRLAVSPLNTITFMPGIQKQWSRCALQLNPYVSVPVASVAYCEKKVDGGLQLRLLFGGKL